MTDTVLKQRTAGAIVLVALGVIFLPMILESPEDPVPGVESHEEIPSPPERPEALSEPPPDVAAQPLSRPESSSEEEAATETNEAREPAEPREPESAGASEGSNGADRWIVQVASFSGSENASVLREQLEEMGYETSVQRQEMDDRTVWRVVAGPYDSRDAAERERDAINQDAGEEGLVIRLRRE